jgi:hypothetical protein
VGETLPVLTLTITMVESTLGTLLMTAVRFATLEADCFLATAVAAVALSAVARSANEE